MTKKLTDKFKYTYMYGQFETYMSALKNRYFWIDTFKCLSPTKFKADVFFNFFLISKAVGIPCK